MTKKESELYSAIKELKKALVFIAREQKIKADMSYGWALVNPVDLREAIAMDVKISRMHLDQLEKSFPELFNKN
jgi:hypothetical protein